MVDFAEIAARYSKVVVVEDALGRSWTVGKLKPSQKVKVAEFAMVASTYSSLHAACSFRAMNTTHYAFPKHREEADSRLDLMDQEGLTAVLKAMNELYADEAPKDYDPAGGVNEAEEVKN